MPFSFSPGRRFRLAAVAALLTGVLGCAGPPATPAGQLSRLLPADFLLVGEQHDAPEHHVLERQIVEILAVQHRLAALALEMVEQGHSTAGLPSSANQAQVRAALAWNAESWPWDDYAPAIMAAVEAGIPVIGANLPRDRQRAAMQDLSLDLRLSPEAVERQRRAIRDSHCGLLADSQIAPMARIQIARDLSMAQTLAKADRPPGRTVLLLAGAGHVLRSVGVPVHLPPELQVRILVAAVKDADSARPLTPDATQADDSDLVWASPAPPERDHCAELRQQMQER
ncbi:MAG: ChaN family lipoprotein [Curvibacter sp.]|nr:ChaN family lipoprotein [Curvibacter sp.]